VRLSDGPEIDVVVGTAAIPGVLPPVRWRGQFLADGGIAGNTPISHAVALGARRIYVLPTQNPGDRGLPRPPRAAVAAAVHAITLLTNTRLQDDLARYTPAAELIVLPALNPQHIALTDFGHAGQLITQALAAAREAITLAETQDVSGSAAGIISSPVTAPRRSRSVRESGRFTGCPGAGTGGTATRFTWPR
jgi:NTE family protein